MMPAAQDAVPAPPAPHEPARIPLDAVRAALRARLDGVGLAADLALAPIDQLFDHPGSTLRFLPEPALYYANHQTSYESFLFSYLHAALTGAPLLVVTHPGLLHNDLGQHLQLMTEHLRRLDHPAASLVEAVAVPAELAAARAFLRGLPDRLDGRALLVHVEGWRESHEGQRLHLMSRDLMDVTERLRRPVVPVRISGGLPARPASHRFHLPYRMARQRFDMGRPIEPATLLASAAPARRRLVLDAINAMAPAAGSPSRRGDVALAKRCLRRHLETGSSSLKCFLLEALASMPDPSPETERLLAFVRNGAWRRAGLRDPDWLLRKAMWLTDGRGLRTLHDAAA